MGKLKPQTRIKRAREAMENILSKMDANRREICSELIENAAFMAVTLADLREEITEKGVVSEYQNGENQWGTKKSPEVEVYNTMIKNYTSVVGTLCSMLPDGNPASNALLSFVQGGLRK